mmetsp:Transcript_16038/g.44352  ORF Transcript_16038/g.44352 Transcript_16038/m.44352 type:complete len:268 (+) Transcript_16038:335-1138(+)
MMYATHGGLEDRHGRHRPIPRDGAAAHGASGGRARRVRGTGALASVPISQGTCQHRHFIAQLLAFSNLRCRCNDLGRRQLQCCCQKNGIELGKLLRLVLANLASVGQRGLSPRCRPSKEIPGTVQWRKIQSGDAKLAAIFVEVPQAGSPAIHALPQEVRQKNRVDHHGQAIGRHDLGRPHAVDQRGVHRLGGVAGGDEVQKRPPGGAKGSMQLVDDVIEHAVQIQERADVLRDLRIEDVVTLGVAVLLQHHELHTQDNVLERADSIV